MLGVSSTLPALALAPRCVHRRVVDKHVRFPHRRVLHRHVKVFAKRNDEATSTSGRSGDANEQLRETLRAAMESGEGRVEKGDAREETGDTDPMYTQSDEPPTRRYRITLRDIELFQYTLPDFFPDFNETPLEARRNLGMSEDLSKANGGGRETRTEQDSTNSKKQPYVWRRGVLAGTERSDPLDVIAKERERFENELSSGTGNQSGTNRTIDTSDAMRNQSNHNQSGDNTSKRRAIPPPPTRPGLEEEELGFFSKTLMGATLFFYLIALFVTTSRTFWGDGEPVLYGQSVTEGNGNEPSVISGIVPTPDSIKGTRAGAIWEDALAKQRQKVEADER